MLKHHTVYLYTQYLVIIGDFVSVLHCVLIETLLFVNINIWWVIVYILFAMGAFLHVLLVFT